MLIDINLKKQHAIKTALIEHMGWDGMTYWAKSPTRPNVEFARNTFYQFDNTGRKYLAELVFKISAYNKIVLDTDKKLLVFGDNLFAVDVS